MKFESVIIFSSASGTRQRGSCSWKFLLCSFSVMVGLACQQLCIAPKLCLFFCDYLNLHWRLIRWEGCWDLSGWTFSEYSLSFHLHEDSVLNYQGSSGGGPKELNWQYHIRYTPGIYKKKTNNKQLWNCLLSAMKY